MDSIRVAICDDDRPARDMLKNILSAYPQYQIEEFADGERLANHYQMRLAPFQLIFLDIYMPNYSGIEVATHIRTYDPFVLIILVTSSSEHTMEGYQVNAFSYVTKPYTTGKIAELLERADMLFNRNDQRIILKSGNEYFQERIANICYVESDDKHLTFHLHDGAEIIVRGKLRDYDKRLADNGFCMVHQSYLVNMNYIAGISKERYKVRLSNGVELPIAKRKLDVVYQPLN